MKRSKQQVRQARRAAKAASRKQHKEATGRTPISKYARKKSARFSKEGA